MKVDLSRTLPNSTPIESRAGIGRQADLAIALAHVPSKLRKVYSTKLLGGRQHGDARVASILTHDLTENRPHHQLHDLAEQGLAGVHTMKLTR